MVTIAKSQSNLLRQSLRGNSIFSAISGLIITFGAGFLVQFMAAGNTIFYLVLGIVLLFHAATLFQNSRTNQINPAFAWYAIVGDVVWVLASAYILLTDSFGLSTEGKWAVLIIADIVLIFAIAQYIGLRRQSR